MPDMRRTASAARVLGRVASRIALAGVFAGGGWQVWNQPDGPAAAAGPFLARCRKAAPQLERHTDRQLVRLNAAVHLGGGVALAAGVAPPAAAALLAGSLAPTTAAAFPFWTQPPGPGRARQRADFLKNLALAGGLLAVALAHPQRRGV